MKQLPKDWWVIASQTCALCGHMRMFHRPKCENWIGQNLKGNVFCACLMFVPLS